MVPATWSLAGICPYIGLKVRMVSVHAAIHHGDDYIAAADGHIPGIQYIDIGISGTDCAVYILTGVMQTPQPIEMGVIRWSDIGIHKVVGFGMFHIRVFKVKFQGLIDVDAFGKLHMLVAIDGKGSPGGDVKPGLIVCRSFFANCRPEFYEEFTGYKGRI
jgi:hypothetical protein